MKIVFLTRFTPPRTDGIGEYTRNLAVALRQKGVQSFILTSQGQPSVEQWIHPVISNWNGPEVLTHLNKIDPDWTSFQFVPQLYGKIGLNWDAAGIPGFLRNKSKSRVSVTFHEYAPAWGFDPKRFFLAAGMRLQTVRILNGCDSVVTTCARYVEDLKKFPGGGKTKMMPVGMNVPLRAFQASDLDALRSKLGIQSGKTFAVFGRMASFRSTDLAVEALAGARKQGIPAFLLLIGCLRSSSPEIFAGLIEKAKTLEVDKFVIETGEISGEEVSKHLSVSDVFLFPQHDGISTRNTTVMSALAHGLPVISFRSVPGNFDGYRVPFGQEAERGDRGAFIKAAVHFISQEDDLHKRQQNRDYAAANFSWPLLADKFLKILEAGK